MAAERRRAIKSMFGQLGMHAAPARVVEALGGVGVDVSETFVAKVRAQMLREDAAAERARAKDVPTSRRRKRPQQRKIPPRRG